MNKKIWTILAANLILLIAVVMFLFDPDKSEDNEISTPLINVPVVSKQGWRKTKTIEVSSKTASSLAFDDKYIYIGDADGVATYYKGKQILHIELPSKVVAITPAKNVFFYYAATARMIVFSDGKTIDKWPKMDSQSTITALTMSGGKLFVADAGKRKVYCYSVSGKKLWEINGNGEDKFIIPSPYFDLSPDGDGGIWVVNPGRHRVENYTAEGKFKASWEPVPKNTMLGCCNPAYLGVLSGDRFVSLEKGLVRSRLFAPSGKIIEYLVPENNFSQGEFRYDLAVLPGNKVAILDGPRNKIDIYEQRAK